MNSEKVFFPELKADDFLHPTDKMALETVKTLKGLDTIINAMNKVAYEKVFRIRSMGDDVRVTKRTCRDIFDMVSHSATILDMPVPDVFINQNPMVNAFTTGTDSPMIQIYSGLIDFFDDDEILAVIAHEMGHIKCGHVLYKTVADFISSGSAFLGPLKILADASIGVALMEWERKAELTSDRAALLVVQDVNVVIKVLMKLAGGSKQIANQINTEDFIEQSRQYKVMSQGLSGAAFKFYLTFLRSHPFPVMRAAEILDWSKSEEYKKMLAQGDKVEIISIEQTGKPEKLVVKNGMPKSVELSWNKPNVNNIKGYNIYRKNGEESFRLVGQQDGKNSINFIDKGLKDNTAYGYYVTSVDLYSVESEPSNISTVTTKKAPEGVTSFSAKSGLVRSAMLSWEPTKEINSNGKIIISRGKGNVSNKLSKIKELGCEHTSYEDKGLDDGQKYFYQIMVTADGLDSVSSGPIIVTTKELISPPQNIKYLLQSNEVMLTWDKVPDSISYEICQHKMMFDKVVGTSKTEDFSYHFINDGIKLGDKFTLYLRSIDDFSRKSEKSEKINIKI